MSVHWNTRENPWVILNTLTGDNLAMSGIKDKNWLLINTKDLKKKEVFWLNEDPRSASPMVRDYIDGEKIAKRALIEVGKYFNKELGNQCANFTRAVLEASGFYIGIADPPADGYLNPYGPGYANSLCGDNLGKKISLNDLKPGDLVFFDNTFGSYPAGTITHVGIYVGGGYFVHRPGANKVNRKDLLTDYYGGVKFREGRRLYK